MSGPTDEEPDRERRQGEGMPEGPPGEEDVPAPAWARLVLVALPFIVLVIVLLVLRSLDG